MSAIAGILNLDRSPVAPAKVSRMLTSMRHRGPDDECIVGFFAADRCPPAVLSPEPEAYDTRAGARHDFLLAHGFLRVGEPADSGVHPIANESRTIWLAFDGHIYNHREMRRVLVQAGHTFRTRNEAEVLLHAYEERPANFLDELDGVFAFALWDDEAKRLLIARDRVGGRPVYYTRGRRCIAFASEVRGLLSSGLVDAQLHFPALAEYMAFQNTFGSETLFKGIKILLPGTMLSVQAGKAQELSWWRAGGGPQKVRDVSLEACVHSLRRALRRSIERQVPTGMPVGCYLSGGIDSAAVVALAASRTPSLSTFTCGFDLSAPAGQDHGCDERADATQLASRFGTCHHEMLLGPGHMPQALPRLVECEEELRLGMTYQNYFAAQLARQHVAVACGGNGGDEILAGYPWRHTPASQCRSLAEFEDFCMMTYHRLVPEADHPNLFSYEAKASIAGYCARESFRGVFKDTDPTDDFLARVLIFELRTITHASLLLDDKIHSFLGLDFRAPLVGAEVLECALALPSSWKLREETGKFVFREAIADLLPAALVWRRKQGFCPPDRTWFQGPMLDYIRGVLFSQRAQDRGIFSREYVERVLDEHVSGLVDHRLLIWSLLGVEWWNRVWVDRDVGP